MLGASKVSFVQTMVSASFYFLSNLYLGVLEYLDFMLCADEFGILIWKFSLMSKL